MSSVMNQIVGNSCGFKYFNEIKQDSIEIIPDGPILEVFYRLNLATLGTICCINKAWKRLAKEPMKIAIYREIAFGNDKWAQCFGTDVVKGEDNVEEFSSLPSDDFIADCRKFKSIFPERNAKDSLMLVRLPKTLNGGLTLKSLGELAKNYFSVSDTGYGFIWPAIVQEQGDKSIDKSRWVLMTKDVLPGSRNTSYGEKQKILAELAEKSLTGYEVPEILESAACILSEYFGSNICLFSNNPGTYTHCKETVLGLQTVVGGLTLAGLRVCSDDCYDDDFIGVAALRRL